MNKTRLGMSDRSTPGKVLNKRSYFLDFFSKYLGYYQPSFEQVFLNIKQVKVNEYSNAEKNREQVSRSVKDDLAKLFITITKHIQVVEVEQLTTSDS